MITRALSSPGFRSAATRRTRNPVNQFVVQTRMQSGGGGASGGRAVIWFRGTDLRLHDNAVVHEAARRVAAGQVAEVRQGKAAIRREPACKQSLGFFAWHVLKPS
jgi:hypothetical protein